MRKQDKIIIWATYFDSAKTRNAGRRIPKCLAVDSPRILEIKEAAERLDMRCELVSNASYPKTPWLEKGMIIVGKTESKNKMIASIAEQLTKIRSAASRE